MKGCSSKVPAEALPEGIFTKHLALSSHVLVVGEGCLGAHSPFAGVDEGGGLLLHHFLQHSHGTHLVVGRVHVSQLNHGDTSTPNVSLNRQRGGGRG